MSEKRYRVPVPKPDTLLVCWGREDSYASPSLVYVYPDLAGRTATRLLMEALEGDRYRPDFGTRGYKVEKSLTKELEDLGYDLTSIKMTIKRKGATPQ